MKVLLCFALLGATLVAGEGLDGFKVIRTDALTEAQASALSKLESSFDFWQQPNAGLPAELMVGPQDAQKVENFLAKINVNATTKIQDVQRLMDDNEGVKGRKLRSGVGAYDWDDYYDVDAIYEYLDDLVAANPSFVSVETFGQTYEGRDLKVIKIEKAGPGAPAIFIEAGIHAREWIAHAVATYTLHELLDNYAAHPQYVDNLNIYVVPMANPDGYSFSRTDERLWRKNRRILPESSIGCVGVDLNRNFGFHWAESGVSASPCGDTYPGDVEFSESESTSLRDLFDSLPTQPDVAVCFHSAAELWLYPYGYKLREYPDNVDEIVSLAEDAVDALNAVNGQTFAVKNAAALYPAAGASDDWYTSLGTRYVYTPELRDNGFGFLLPANLIIPSGEEVWAAWEVIFQRVFDDNGISP